MRSFEVQIFEVTRRNDRRAKPWRVRWAVAGERFEELFRTKALANSFRSELTKAANSGEPFDTETGLPVSEARARTTTTCYKLALKYIEMKWPRLAAKSRRSTVESLVTVTVEFVGPSRVGRPDPAILREALNHYAFNPHRLPSDRPARHAAALAWLEKASLPVAELDSLDIVRSVLDRLAMRLDGRPAAANTSRRKRAVLYNWLGYAVEQALLDYNPLDRIQWTAPEPAEAVDRRVVANPTQVAGMLATLASLGGHANRLVAYFGCLYYAGTRPSEAADLRLPDCELPGRCTNCDTAFDDLLAVIPALNCPHVLQSGFEM